jgi:hypothetical protein
VDQAAVRALSNAVVRHAPSAFNLVSAITLHGLGRLAASGIEVDPGAVRALCAAVSRDVPATVRLTPKGVALTLVAFARLKQSGTLVIDDAVLNVLTSRVLLAGAYTRPPFLLNVSTFCGMRLLTPVSQ